MEFFYDGEYYNLSPKEIENVLDAVMPHLIKEPQTIVIASTPHDNSFFYKMWSDNNG